MLVRSRFSKLKKFYLLGQVKSIKTMCAHLNPKNELIEWCQKRHLPPPAFVCLQVPDRQDHMPQFICEVTVIGVNGVNDDNCIRCRGISTNKKRASIAAAEKALRVIKLSQPTRHKPLTVSKRQQKQSFTDLILRIQNSLKVIFVDAENIDLSYAQISGVCNVEIIAFVSKNTTKKVIFELANQFSFITLFVSERVGRDAADFMLAVYLGKVSMIKHPQLYVLTKDHYGEHLESFVKNCSFVCSFEDCFE